MAMAQYCTNIIWPLNLSVVTIAISMTVSTTVAMSVSMTVSSMTIAMTVSTVSMGVSTISTDGGLEAMTVDRRPGSRVVAGMAEDSTVTVAVSAIVSISISISTPLAIVVAVSTISKGQSLGRPVDVGRGAVSPM